MPESWVVGIDLGTTYFKIGLFTRNGRLAGLGRVAAGKQCNIQGCLCELPVSRFEALIGAAWRDACRSAGTEPDATGIAGIAYSSQANSLILLDSHEQPLTPLILWPDRRAPQLESLVKTYDARPDRRSVSGLDLAIGEGFGINKLLWTRRHHPELWRKTRRVMTISDYLVWRLTGSHIGDPGTSGLLGIVDSRLGDWWPEALETLQIDRTLLTPLAPPGAMVGVTSEAAATLGFPAGIPFTLGSLDHHMAALGVGVPSQAPASVSLGTVLACVAMAPQYRKVSGGYCGQAMSGQGFFLLTFCDNGGGNLEWFQRRHTPELSFAQLDSLADSVAPGCDGLEALPNVASYPELEGFANATTRHTTGHYFRALMESSARSLASLLQPFGMPKSVILTGGGAHSAVWRRIISQTTGAATLRRACEEPACRGAAMTAAVNAGWFSDFKEAVSSWETTEDMDHSSS